MAATAGRTLPVESNNASDPPPQTNNPCTGIASGYHQTTPAPCPRGVATTAARTSFRNVAWPGREMGQVMGAVLVAKLSHPPARHGYAVSTTIMSMPYLAAVASRFARRSVRVPCHHG